MPVKHMTIIADNAREHVTLAGSGGRKKLRLNFESRLTQQLADLDDYYNKVVEASEGDAAL